MVDWLSGGEPLLPPPVTALRLPHRSSSCSSRSSRDSSFSSSPPGRYPTRRRISTEEFALHLAVLTDHERGPPTSHAKHQAQGAKVAIFDPELILPDVLEHLSDQATLLCMAILAQKHIGN